MIRKRLAMIVLAVTLSACGEAENEEDANRDAQNLTQDVPGSAMEIKKTQNGPARKMQRSKDSAPVQNRLPRLTPATSSEDQINDFEDIEELEQYRQDYDEAVDVDDKSEALIALVQADEKNAASLLQEAYQSPEPELRKEAVMQMQDFTDNKQVVDLLLQALDDPDSEVVTEAIEGLSGLESQRAMDGLNKVAQSHPDESVRELAKNYVDEAREFDQEVQ